MPRFGLHTNYKNERTGKTKVLFWVKNNPKKKNNSLLVDLIRYDMSLDSAYDSLFSIPIKTSISDSLALKNFFYNFLNNIEKGKIKVFDYLTIENYLNFEDDSIKYLSQNEIDSLFIQIDSVSKQLSEPPYSWYDTIIVSNLIEQPIEGVRFVESWYFDENTLEIKKVIHGFSIFVTKTSYNYGNTSIAHQKYTGLREIFYYSFTTPKRFFDLK